MYNWKDDILNGVCRCWVALAESRTKDEGIYIISRRGGSMILILIGSSSLIGIAAEEIAVLHATLQDVCQDLAKTCPSVVEVWPISRA